MLSSPLLQLCCLILQGCAALTYPVPGDGGTSHNARHFVVRREQGLTSQHVAGDFVLQRMESDVTGKPGAMAEMTNSAVDQSRHPPYRELILMDGAAAYYPLDDALSRENGASTVAAWGSAGRLSALDGIVQGNPEFNGKGLIDSDVGSTAVLFTGTRHQAIKLHGSPRSSDRTIELWFQSGDLTYSNQTLYMEGDEMAGIHIFVSMQDGYDGWENGPAYLYMLAWNRGSDEARFAADDSIDWGPIRCEIRQGERNYIALVFEGSSAEPNYKGFIKSPGSAWYARQCGSTIHLPIGASLGGNSEACIGGVCGSTRNGVNGVNDVIREVNSTTNYLEGARHTFHGTIDEVAIYNLALDRHKINNHVAAAMA